MAEYSKMTERRKAPVLYMYTVYEAVWMAEYSELIEHSEGPILYMYTVNGGVQQTDWTQQSSYVFIPCTTKDYKYKCIYNLRYDVVWIAEYSELTERSEVPIYVYCVRRRLNGGIQRTDWT